MSTEHPAIARFRSELATRGGSGRIVVLPAAVHTAALAAEALGCEVGAIANSLLFDAGGAPGADPHRRRPVRVPTKQERKIAHPGIPPAMVLSLLTLFAGAALGGGIAVGLTALIVFAAIALALIATAHGARTVALMFRVLQD